MDREEREYNLAMEKALLEKQKQEQELKVREIEHKHELEVLHVKRDVKGEGQLMPIHSVSKPSVPKIPAFDEGKDEMDSFIRRFERYAEAQHWPPGNWATNLSALLKGKALDVYALMPAEQALDYEALKNALLRRYDLTEDGFKRKFRLGRPEVGETFGQFVVRSESYFQRWVDMAKINKTFEDLCDLMVREQFLQVCNRDLALFLKERVPTSKVDMACLADQFREARYTSAVSLTQPLIGPTRGVQFDSIKPEPDVSKTVDSRSRSFVPKSDRTCYRCGKKGHIATECRPRPRNVGSVTPAEQGAYGEWPQEGIEHIGYANVVSGTSSICIVPAGNARAAWAEDNSTSVTSSCDYKSSMPVSSGYVNGKSVKILRDTGCSGVAVQRGKVSDEDLTGKVETCVLADGSSVRTPVARIFVDSPYFKGSIDAWCMETPVYDLIIGNVEGVREPSNPDPEWQPVGAVETRAHAKNKGKPYPKLKLPEIIRSDIGVEDIRVGQANDPTLVKIRKLAEEEATASVRSGKVRWFKRKGVIYREYVSPKVNSGRKFNQLVVPKEFRESVMELAHESVMSGHLATKRTVCRVLSRFYWPGVQSDTKRFCQSCDICQRTTPKGKTRKVPLGYMPLIDVPFKRVAVDLVGPLYPVTDKGNRYILTLVDYAARYPEAVALPSIETCKLARERLTTSSKRYMRYYNRGAKERSVKVGEKVLVLLTQDSNKLLVRWKGPFTIVEKVGRDDYRIDMGGKINFSRQSSQEVLLQGGTRGGGTRGGGSRARCFSGGELCCYRLLSRTGGKSVAVPATSGSDRRDRQCEYQPRAIR
jgi:hypothetical protein